MSGRPSGINYVKPSDPSFLTKFKQQAGYKEGPSVETKRELPKFDEDDNDRPEDEDEKPTVVVLRDGDLTQAEVEEYAKNEDKEGVEEPSPTDGKIMFKKPVKRPSEDSTASDLKATSGKKKKKQERRHQKGRDGKGEGKDVRNASLLSFGDDDEES